MFAISNISKFCVILYYIVIISQAIIKIKFSKYFILQNKISTKTYDQIRLILS